MPLAAMIVVTVSQVLEGAMLVCFGISWPCSILKMVRTRQTAGKSTAFIILVLCGYLAGLSAKLVRAAQGGVMPEAISVLYALNALLVATDLVLFLRYRSAGPAEAARHQA